MADLELNFRNQRPLVAVPRETVAHFDGVCSCGERFEEAVVDAFLNIYT